jgi:hypothetical protein
MGIFLATIDGSIVNIDTHPRGRLQQISPTIEWVVLAYLVTMAALLLGVAGWRT